MRSHIDRSLVLPYSDGDVLQREVERAKKMQRGDRISQVVLKRGPDGEMVGNRQSRRVAKALARRGRLG